MVASHEICRMSRAEQPSPADPGACGREVPAQVAEIDPAPKRHSALRDDHSFSTHRPHAEVMPPIRRERSNVRAATGNLSRRRLRKRLGRQRTAHLNGSLRDRPFPVDPVAAVRIARDIDCENGFHCA